MRNALAHTDVTVRTHTAVTVHTTPALTHTPEAAV
ncbi:hypothetical protein GA0115233_108130 [Streptomyces sp. DI166]|nr:hypothetical protein GA0115233_108130 [Streptomyces sp. DI166]